MQSLAAAVASSVRRSLLFKSQDGTTSVHQCRTPAGPVVEKLWENSRIMTGANRTQPFGEYSAMLDLGDCPLFCTPVGFEACSEGMKTFYVDCSSNAHHCSTQLGKSQSPQHTQNLRSQFCQRICVQLLLALWKLQHEGLVHRDVTPTNILVRGSAICRDMWLSDFGLACRAKTLSGYVAGCNVAYIAPEMVTRDPSTGFFVVNTNALEMSRVTTTALDIYQAGVTLYELYTGRRPPGLESTDSNARELSAYLSRVASYNWRAAINSCVRPTNPGLASVLDAMLLLDPESRHSPAQLLQQQPHLQAAYKAAAADLPRRYREWAHDRACACQALQYLKAAAAIQGLAAEKLLLPEPAAIAAPAARATTAETPLAQALAAPSACNQVHTAGQHQQQNKQGQGQQRPACGGSSANSSDAASAGGAKKVSEVSTAAQQQLAAAQQQSHLEPASNDAVMMSDSTLLERWKRLKASHTRAELDIIFGPGRDSYEPNFNDPVFVAFEAAADLQLQEEAKHLGITWPGSEHMPAQLHPTGCDNSSAADSGDDATESAEAEGSVLNTAVVAQADDTTGDDTMMRSSSSSSRANGPKTPSAAQSAALQQDCCCVASSATSIQPEGQQQPQPAEPLVIVMFVKVPSESPAEAATSSPAGGHLVTPGVTAVMADAAAQGGGTAQALDNSCHQSSETPSAPQPMSSPAELDNNGTATGIGASEPAGPESDVPCVPAAPVQHQQYAEGGVSGSRRPRCRPLKVVQSKIYSLLRSVLGRGKRLVRKS